MTFRNLADESVYVNFRGEFITISSQKTVIVNNIPKGRYEYETTYTIPRGTKSSNTVGDVSGEVIINPGTKALLVYSSVFSIDSIYTIGATLTTSDDLDDGTTTP